MKQFFKIVFASMVGFVLTFVLIALIIVGVVGAAISKFSDAKEEKAVQDSTVLLLNFQNGVADRAPGNPFENFDFSTMESNNPLGLWDVLENLKKAKTDDKIKGIFIDVDGLDMNLANLDEVRQAIVEFKKSGKFVIAYAETMEQGGYYLATAADKIFLYPEGDLLIRGLMSELVFMKEMFEKLEIEMQVIRGKNNKFKSAVEPFIADRMSDANREQITRYLNSIWGVWASEISTRRNIPEPQLQLIADSLKSWSPQRAVELGLIDGVLYRDQMMDTLRKKLGIDPAKDVNFATLREYDRSPGADDESKPKKWKIKEKIAVVYGAGEIGSGKAGSDAIGSKTMSEAIRDATKDTTIKAIVLRINSPGGSALASDVIWREVAIAKEKKPVVVSMGALAASGGYYIACNADRIFAGHNTITGSIGVFGLMPNAQRFFNNKIGVRFDGVNTHQNSNIGMPTRPLTPYQFEVIQNTVEEVYGTFISHVSEGRKLSPAKVDSIGQGRVWTGKDALALGLVDEIGGLDAAINFAADKVKLENYRVVGFPEQKSPFEEFKANFSASLFHNLSSWYLGDHAQYLKMAKGIGNSETIQTRLQFNYVIY